jgi:hypothetical protein
MNRPWKLVLIAAFVSVGASAQTAVTTSGGTTYNIPAFNGAASLGGSPIYALGNNVGIGTTTPTTALQVAGSISAQVPGGDPSFVLYKGDGGAANLFSGIANTGTNGFNRLSFFTNNAPQWAGSTENMVILNSGNVGVGTIAPQRLVQVGQSFAQNPSLQIGGSDNSSAGSYALLFGAWRDVEANMASGIVATPVWACCGGYPLGSGPGIYPGIRANSLSFYNLYNPANPSESTPEMFLDGTDGYMGLGTVTPAEKLEVNGNIKLTSGSGGHVVFTDGSQQSVAWTGVLSGGDYAESVDISRMRDSLEPGDLITIDEEQNGRFIKSSTAYSPLVSGVYATKPGVVGRRQPRAKSQEDEVPMAMVGIVPTKVSTENGPIRRGDLLVSSSTPGYAMKGTDREKLTGAVLGKALETLDSGKGLIEVLISLQ